jgi:transposase
MQSFYLGADVSKGYADFVILDGQKRTVVENFQLDDTSSGHRKLFTVLGQLLDRHPKATVFAAVESTGGYENNWYHSLQRFQMARSISVARLNPLGVMHNSKADLKRNTTDKISARSIAEYLIGHPEKVSYRKDDQWAGLRKQWGFIKMLNKQCTQMLNQFESLLYIANPDLLAFCKDGVPNWILKLSVKYATAAHLARGRASAIAKIPYVTKQRAKELIATAKDSVASALDPFTKQLVEDTAKQILHLRKTIKTQEARLVAQCDMPEVELLNTFKGIGEASAVGLMLEIQAVERFDSAKKLASFFGLHPVFKSSGDGSSGFKMSKQGRKEPRRILFMVAMTAIRSNPLIQEVYEQHRSRGKAKMDAIGVCMHKILRILYGMLKNRTPFDPQIDKNNRHRAVGNAAAPKEDKSRRYQGFDPAAPISGRQNKKRLERKEPHCADDTTCGVIAPVPEPST